MGDIKPILEEILNEAQAKSDRIRNEAKLFCEKEYAAFDEEKKQLQAEFEKKLEGEIDRLYETAKKDIALQEKTELLRIKKEAIDAAIDYAIEKICALCDECYIELLSGLYEKNERGGIIYMNSRDIKRVKPEAFPGAEISPEAVQIRGGFYHVCKRCDYDCTISAIAGEMYDEAVFEANRIFTEE